MRAALVLLALCCMPVAQGAEVYRCVTENGVVRYTDQPCKDGKVDKLNIKNDRTDPAAAEAQAKQRAEQLAALDKAASEAEKAAQEESKQAEERARKCADARARLQRLVAARRVTEGEGADRKFLESDEIIQRRQEAQDQVNEFCGN